MLPVGTEKISLSREQPRPEHAVVSAAYFGEVTIGRLTDQNGRSPDFCSAGLRFVRQGIRLRLPNGKLREECDSDFDVSLHKDDSSFTARKCPDVLLTES